MRTPLVAFVIAVLFAVGCIVFAVSSGGDAHGVGGDIPSTLRSP
jgi:hypothetical protein